jgi:hypothetical protein
MKTIQRNDIKKENTLFGVSLSLLISRATENAVIMPSGLSREQRRVWAREQVQKIQN